MVLTCGIDGARQARVQQPQQLGAPTVDATESSDVEAVSHCLDTGTYARVCRLSERLWFLLHQKWSSSLRIERWRRPQLVPDGRNNVLKRSRIKTICPTLACTGPLTHEGGGLRDATV